MKYPSFSFGLNSQEADALLALVLEGKKTATCSTYKPDNKEQPKKGNRFVILDGNNKPSCLIEITQVEVKRFCEVDESFAYLEGEGDRSLEFWKKAHKEHFENQKCYDPEMQLLCETFKVIERI